MVALPVLLVAGIIQADKATRATGFSEMPPVVEIKKDTDNAVTLSVFDSSFRISGEVTSAFSAAADVVQATVPPSTRTGALITETIADWILRAAYQER